MRLAIVGSREINDPQVLLDALKKVPSLDMVTEIVSGGAKGVDSLARAYAHENNLKLTEFLPDYDSFGRSAPLHRNTEIIEYADIVLAIPVKGSSNGTRDSIRKAQTMGKRLYIHEVSSVPKVIKDTSLKVPKAVNHYKIGDLVCHDKFGEGSVTAVEGQILTVAFVSGDVKRFSCSFKGLHKSLS